MIKLSRFFGFASIACGALVLLAGNLAAQMPSGTLEVRGSVQITKGASGESMTVRDTNYSWFSGDRIQVRNGYGILYLNEGNSLGFLEGTDATLTIDNGTISGTLESGDLIYAIEGKHRELLLQSGEFEFNAMPADDLAPCLGLTAAGMIQAIASTRNRVIVQSGELLGYNRPRTVERRVAPGEKYEFTPQAARRLELDLPPEVEEMIDTDRSALPCIVWWKRQEVAGAAIAGLSAESRIGLGITGISGTIIGYQIIDDDKDPDPVSP